MNPCAYQKAAKCEDCTYVYYQQCPKFVRARTAYLLRAIRPFKMKSQEFKERAVWSNDADRAKSVAAQMAIKMNHEVTKYTLNQALTLTVDGSEIPGKVIYLEAPCRFTGEVDKIQSCLHSFVDRVLLNGGCISMYLNPVTSLRYTDIEKV